MGGQEEKDLAPATPQDAQRIAADAYVPPPGFVCGAPVPPKCGMGWPESKDREDLPKAVPSLLAPHGWGSGWADPVSVVRISDIGWSTPMR